MTNEDSVNNMDQWDIICVQELGFSPGTQGYAQKLSDGLGIELETLRDLDYERNQHEHYGLYKRVLD